MPLLLRTALLGIMAAAAAVGAASSTTAAVPSPSTSTSSSSKACNNSPTLCGRRYNNITHMGAHDSSFLRDASTGNSVSGNQFKNATVALDAGVRLLQAQVHDKNGTLHLCHSDCALLDAGPLTDWLALIAAWIKANANDVVTILLVNADRATAATLGADFAAAGLDKLAYTPSATSATANWPTLQSMISNNTRLVAFATDFDYSASVPYLLPEFDFMFETPYEVTEGTGFNCTLDRPSTATLNKSPTTAISLHYLSLVNHFQYQRLLGTILIPDVDSINVTNSPNTAAAGNFGRHVQQCNSEWGARPNFVLVDFWNVEDPITAVDRVNGLSDITGRASVSAQIGTTSSGASLSYSGGLLVSLAAAMVLLA
ncbi:PLC-like phosphodiesterase [Cordyceps militaris]|uniref:PLC-like phosphodiesterase n=1 Tax=Cordyceps militaris TaxID=73501 RepID=A0A2H4SVB4_CORMI|nr:PLC-like phosphodiesterase [Cordyceps militaris]